MVAITSQDLIGARFAPIPVTFMLAQLASRVLRNYHNYGK